MDIRKVLPGDNGYEKIRDLVDRHEDGLTNYDALATSYNLLPKGGIMIIKMRSTATLGNVARVLYGRGVERNTDYTMHRLKEDAKGVPIPRQKRPVAIKRLTPVDMLVKKT